MSVTVAADRAFAAAVAEPGRLGAAHVMPSKGFLRLLVVAHIVLGIASIVYSLPLSSLPEPVRAFLRAESEAAMLGSGVILVLSIPLIILILMSSTGLLFFWRPARILYLITIVAGLLLTPFSGPTLYAGWGKAFEEAAIMVSGIILALIYLSPLKDLYVCSAARSAIDEQHAGGRTVAVMNAALWVVQALLAAVFLYTGAAKLVLPIGWLKHFFGILGPVPFLRFLGVAETLGGLGLLLPGLLRIRPGLTPLAAAGLAIEMIGVGLVIVLAKGAVSFVPLYPVVLGVLAAFVAYGRWRMAPHPGRSRESSVASTRCGERVLPWRSHRSS